MSVVVKSDELRELVDPDGEVQELGSGFKFTEGPVWNAAGEFLLFSDMPGNVRRRWNEADGVSAVMRPANQCNGMVYDSAGNLLVCEHTTSTLVRERPGGTREALATHFRGKELNSPNDVVTRSDGTIYFSDPWYGRMPVFGVERERDLGFQGVYKIPPGGGDLELVVAEDEFEMPNGLCFSPDESLLYINDTPNARISVYDVAADGTLSNGRLFLGDIGDGEVDHGAPDGMKCAATCG
jgi:gluconolactonase